MSLESYYGNHLNNNVQRGDSLFYNAPVMSSQNNIPTHRFEDVNANSYSITRTQTQIQQELSNVEGAVVKGWLWKRKSHLYEKQTSAPNNSCQSLFSQLVSGFPFFSCQHNHRYFTLDFSSLLMYYARGDEPDCHVSVPIHFSELVSVDPSEECIPNDARVHHLLHVLTRRRRFLFVFESCEARDAWQETFVRALEEGKRTVSLQQQLHLQQQMHQRKLEEAMALKNALNTSNVSTQLTANPSDQSQSRRNSDPRNSAVLQRCSTSSVKSQSSYRERQTTPPAYQRQQLNFNGPRLQVTRPVESVLVPQPVVMKNPKNDEIQKELVGGLAVMKREIMEELEKLSSVEHNSRRDVDSNASSSDRHHKFYHDTYQSEREAVVFTPAVPSSPPAKTLNGSSDSSMALHAVFSKDSDYSNSMLLKANRNLTPGDSEHDKRVRAEAMASGISGVVSPIREEESEDRSASFYSVSDTVSRVEPHVDTSAKNVDLLNQPKKTSAQQLTSSARSFATTSQATSVVSKSSKRSTTSKRKFNTLSSSYQPALALKADSDYDSWDDE